MPTSLVHPNSKETWSDSLAIFPAVVSISPTGTAFTGSYSHAVAGYDRMWIRQASAGNGRTIYPLPRQDDGAGQTLITIVGDNIVIAQSGSPAHDWTGYQLDVFIEYTLASQSFFDFSRRYAYMLMDVEP